MWFCVVRVDTLVWPVPIHTHTVWVGQTWCGMSILISVCGMELHALGILGMVLNGKGMGILIGKWLAGQSLRRGWVEPPPTPHPGLTIPFFHITWV